MCMCVCMCVCLVCVCVCVCLVHVCVHIKDKPRGKAGGKKDERSQHGEKGLNRDLHIT